MQQMQRVCDGAKELAAKLTLQSRRNGFRV